MIQALVIAISYVVSLHVVISCSVDRVLRCKSVCICSNLNVDSLQLLSTSLGVQVLVVLSGLGVDGVENGTRNDDKKSLVLNSSEGVEHRVVQSTLQRLGGEWGNSVHVDVLLLWGAHRAPPAHISLSVRSSHD